MTVRSAYILAIGAAISVIGAFAFPGMPACQFWGENYSGFFLSNVAISVALLSTGLLIAFVGCYEAGFKAATGRKKDVEIERG